MNQIIAWTLFSVFGATYLYLIWLGRKIGSLKFDISVLDKYLDQDKGVTDEFN